MLILMLDYFDFVSLDWLPYLIQTIRANSNNGPMDTNMLALLSKQQQYLCGSYLQVLGLAIPIPYLLHFQRSRHFRQPFRRRHNRKL
jgi:hypothetical protein